MDPLNTIAGVVIGVALSAIFGAGVFRKAREEQEEATRVRIEQVEQELAEEHEAELQSRIAALEADYLKQSDALKASYERESEQKETELQGQLQALEATLKREKEEAIAKLRAEDKAQGQQSPPDVVLAPPAVEASPEETTTEIPPQVPPTPTLTIGSHLVAQLQGWGESKQLRYIAQMQQYCFSVDSQVREQVAIALKTLTTGQPVRGEVKTAIALLGKLSTDSQASVRLAAIQALGGIKSPQVIPYLQKALQDSSSEVIKTASAAMQKFKFYPTSAPVQVAKPALKATKVKVKA
ncbi:HEAT repeat domain-containing protein [Spirulina subsalsa]|uniref:HEAT repeat domain-containing protein n=1 Tax=Spirulina subsalsa TaxID=54311 RepID=UPI000316C385|nr:HEAT repeat domain-containing protein [Spirulina subsalsa]